MKKRNLILQAAVAGLFCAATLPAFASGSASNAIGNSAQIASQAVGPTSVIGSGSLQYTVSGAIPQGNYVVYVQLSGGATFAFPSAAVAAGALVSSSGTVTVSAGTVLAGNTSIVAFPIAVPLAGAPVSTTFTFKPTGIVSGDGGITGAQAAAGVGSLSATMSMGSSASYSAGLTAIQTDEAAAATAPIAIFVSGINAAALSSASFGSTTSAPSVAFTGAVAEKAQINVLGGATGVTLTGNTNLAASATSTELLDLGGFYFVDVSTDASASSNPLGAAATATFNLVTNYATAVIGATLTGPAGFFSNAAIPASTGVVAGSVYLSGTNTCTAALVGGAGTVTANGTTVTFSSVTPPAAAAVTGNGGNDVAAGVGAAATSSIVGPVYVCMTAATPNTNQLVTGQPSITANLTNVATPANGNAVTIASTPLYNLQANGGSAYVREYIPAAVSGYTTYIRVINTGPVSASVSASIVSDTTGKTGIPGVLGTVPAGGAITVGSSTVEAAIIAAGGVAPTGVAGAASGWRPRLLVTAPTTIAVQSFISDVNGAFSEVSGGNVGNITGPVNVSGGNSTNGNINPNNQ